MSLNIDEVIQEFELPLVKTYSVTFGKTEDTKEKSHSAVITITKQDGKVTEHTHKGKTFQEVKNKIHSELSKATARIKSDHITFNLFKNPSEQNHQALLFLIEQNGNVIQKSIDGNSFEEIINGAVEYWKSLHKSKDPIPTNDPEGIHFPPSPTISAGVRYEGC